MLLPPMSAFTAPGMYDGDDDDDQTVTTDTDVHPDPGEESYIDPAVGEGSNPEEDTIL